MQGEYRLAVRCVGFGLARFLRAVTSSLDYQIAYYDRSADPSLPDYAGPCVWVLWHEYLALPTPLWGNCEVAALVSQHRDGDWAACAAEYLGFDIVRGSTTRGGAEALRQLKDKSRLFGLTMTPDGPKGPRRTMAPGAIYLASRLGLPLVPVGFGCDRPFRVRSWDRFAVPRPFSRARGIFGPRLTIPPRLRRDGLEEYRRRVEAILNRLTLEAEDWAATGIARENSVSFPRPRLPKPSRRERSGPAGLAGVKIVPTANPPVSPVDTATGENELAQAPAA